MVFYYKGKRFDLEGVDDEDHIIRSIRRSNSFYELRFLEYLRILFGGRGACGACIDVGANIGNHSIFLSSFIGCQVYSIEANYEAYGVLEKNINRNGSGAKPFNMALGEKDGWGSVFIPETVDNNLGMARVEMAGKDGDSVRIISLDNFVEQNVVEDDVCFIKIDVEGMEGDVIRGGKETIDKFKPHVFAEAGTEKQFEEISEVLGALGYEPLQKFGATPMWHFCSRPNLFSRLSFMMAGRKAKKISKNK